jgi:hypothetical protein
MFLSTVHLHMGLWKDQGQLDRRLGRLVLMSTVLEVVVRERVRKRNHMDK